MQQDLADRPVFRDARGNEWNGQGEMSSWLSAVKNAGVNPDFFRIEPTSQATIESSTVDPRQMDLFF